MLEDHNPFTREAVIRALGRIRDDRAAEPLVSRLDDLFDRQAAGAALCALGQKAEGPILARLGRDRPADFHSRHQDDGARAEACKVLAVIGTRKSIPSLEKMAAEDDFRIKPEAKRAISAITARQAKKR
jgi:HEAT repeat protein